MHVDSGRGSVFLSWRCDTICTSSFVNDVMFARDRPGRGNVNGALLTVTAEGRIDLTQ